VHGLGKINLLIIFIHSSMALQPFVGPWPLLQFRNHFTQTVRLLGRGISPSQRPLHTHRTTQTENKSIQTSMPRVVFESTISAFERAKTFYVLNREVTVIGTITDHLTLFPKHHYDYESNRQRRIKSLIFITIPSV
jgi:hypothetical protein